MTDLTPSVRHSVPSRRSRFTTGVAVALLMLLAVPAAAAPGDLDPTFGDGGRGDVVDL